MQTPYSIRFVRREIPVPGHEIPSALMRPVLVPQQFIPVKQFSESKQRTVEFWSWVDVPLVNESDNLKIADAVQIPIAG